MRSFHDARRATPVELCVVVALAMAMAVAATRPARAHSWYDADCCSDHDCEPVSAVSYVASDTQSLPVMVVTTNLGTKPVTPQTKIRQSKDSKMHACIYQGQLLCLYLPPSN
jgi:hypothetical protein